MIDLNKLNPEQKQAVLTTEGPLLILAGAGSGKTRVLTYRAAYLLEKGVPPWAILAITFTNKAAREMRERINRLAGEAADDMWVMTFHALSARILRRDIEKLGYKREFSIYDDDDQMTLIKRILKKLDISDKSYPPRAVKSVISDAKNHMLSPEEWLKDNPDFRSKPYYRAYCEYEKELKENNALDFDDLILKTLELLTEHPPVLEVYRRKFSYIMVDEYQEHEHGAVHARPHAGGRQKERVRRGRRRPVDLRLARRGSSKHSGVRKGLRRLSGDQAGAELPFHRQHSGRGQSGSSHTTPGRKEKALWTDADAGDKIKLYHALDERDEAAWVCDVIQSLTRGGYELGDMAVLYRTNAQSRVLEEALVRRGIRYGVYGGLKFYDRKEVKDVIAYLRVLVNPDDDISLRRIINEPRRGIGDSTVETIAAYAAQHGLSLLNALMEAENAGLSSRALTAVRGFTELLITLTGDMLDKPASEFITGLIEQTGLEKQYENDKEPENESRRENIHELVSAVIEYDRMNPEGGMVGFLENVALVTDTDRMEEKASLVTLMTLHSAKGLEFPVVYLTGLEEGIFPISRAMFNEEQMEEERRLMYVGVTRAKKKLFLSHARNRMLYNARQSNEVSRFVTEIPARVLEENRQKSETRVLPRPFGQRANAGGQAARPEVRPGIVGRPSIAAFRAFRRASARSRRASFRSVREIRYAAGDRVFHKAFGNGVVKQVAQTAGGARVTVDFGEGKGVKTFAGDAPMIKIG